MSRLFVLACSMVLLISCQLSGQNNYSLSPQVFEEKSKEAGIQLLDVRTPEEFNSGKLANSINIDFHAPDFKEQIATLDKSKTCYIYCRSGNRSHKAGVMMEEMKFNKVVDMGDGIVGWQENGFSVE